MKAEFDDLAPKQADDNQLCTLNYIDKSMLTGTDDYTILRNQMRLDKYTVQQVTACDVAAWRSFSPLKGKNQLLPSQISKQKPEELLYEDFVASAYRGCLQNDF